MTPEAREQRIYVLKEGVRIFRSDAEEIRFRKGVWSYNEAIIKLTGQEERVVRFFNLVADGLSRDDKVDAAELAEAVDASAEELESYCEVLDGLRSQQFLYDGRQQENARIVSGLLGGNLSGFEEYVGAARPVLFFTDTEYAENAAKSIAGEVGLPLDVMAKETATELMQVDLTTRTDAIEHLENVARLERALSGYACVLGCISAPNLTQLRNLNRLLIHAEKPLILGLIDGPFVSLLSTLANETGCFECYEQRMMARLEDTLVYHKFVESTADETGGNARRSWFAPQLHMLTAAVLSEGFLYSTLSMLRLAGRIVNIYQPLLEIQVQDLLRVPYCPACGFISKAKMNEMYTSTKQVVSEMLESVELESEE